MLRALILRCSGPSHFAVRGLALLATLASSACTFYTSCPNGTTGGDTSMGGNSTGTGGSGGRGGSTAGGNGNSGGLGGSNGTENRAWAPATSNLEGLDSACGNLFYVSAHPTRDLLIAAVQTQGLWASEDGSEKWTQLGQGKGSATIENGTEHIVYDPDDADRFWQAGSYGPCAYTTSDSGATFTQLSATRHCDSISVDFSDKTRSLLLAGGHEQHTLYKSVDGGTNWEDLGPNIPTEAGATGFTHILDADTYLVASWQGASKSGVFRTTDGGKSWKRVYSGGIDSRALVAQDGNIYWVTNSNENNAGLIKSDDQGLTWEKVPGSDVILTTEQGLVELPDGRIATRGATHLLISADHGQHWQAVGQALPFIPWGVTYSPFRKAFYIWHWSCVDGNNPIPEDAILKLDFDYETE